MKLPALTLSLLIALVLAACGGSAATPDAAPAANGASTESSAAGPSDTSTDASGESGDVVETVNDAAEEAAGDMVESLEDLQAASGGGSATLAVGDESWTFAPVLCAFGDEIGQEGAEFVLSSLQDGKQMYFSIDSFGHNASIDDIKDFENPSVSMSSTGGTDFIVLDGKSFSGTAEFLDGTSDSFSSIPGSLSGTCP